MAATQEERVSRSLALEKAYVHDVYEQFSEGVRGRPWPKVNQFLADLEPGALVCDVGCGQGKYLNANPSIFNIGADKCSRLTKIAKDKENEVLICDNLSLPFRDESFDAVLSVAVVHHFATTERRVCAIRELARILRIGGRLIISVWAMEQTHRRFESQDVLVPWHRPQTLSTPSLELTSTTNTSEEDVMPYHAYTQTSDSDSNKSLRTKAGFRKRGRTKHKGRSIDPNRSSSPSSSSLSSPNETCYSFVRRAIQKLAGSKRSGSSHRPWFLETWNTCTKEPPQKRYDPDGCESYDCGNIQDLPIELRRVDDDEPPQRRQTFPSSQITTVNDLYGGIKSKSLTNIKTFEEKSMVRSQSSVPSLQDVKIDDKPQEATLSNKSSTRSLNKPKLVKQKQSICDEDPDEALDKPTDMKKLVNALPDFRVYHAHRGSSLKNGFVRMFQGWKATEVIVSPTQTEEPSEPAKVEPIKTSAVEETKKEPAERRHSKEDGSDSSKDSSLQSDTSVDSEDSFASVIFVPKQDPISPGPLSPGPTSPRLTKQASVPNSPRMKQNSCPTSPRIKNMPLTVYPLTKQLSSPKPTTKSNFISPNIEEFLQPEITCKVTEQVEAAKEETSIQTNNPKTTSLAEKYSVVKIPKFKKPVENEVEDKKRTERLRQIRELLNQRPGFGIRSSRSAFPIVRHCSSSNGKNEPIVRPLPRLLSLELFNPETDDKDSDSSGVSSPDSVDSVINIEVSENNSSGSKSCEKISPVKQKSPSPTKFAFPPVMESPHEAEAEAEMADLRNNTLKLEVPRNNSSRTEKANVNKHEEKRKSISKTEPGRNSAIKTEQFRMIKEKSNESLSKHSRKTDEYMKIDETKQTVSKSTKNNLAKNENSESLSTGSSDESLHNKSNQAGQSISKNGKNTSIKTEDFQIKHSGINENSSKYMRLRNSDECINIKIDDTRQSIPNNGRNISTNSNESQVKNNDKLSKYMNPCSSDEIVSIAKTDETNNHKYDDSRTPKSEEPRKTPRPENTRTKTPKIEETLFDNSNIDQRTKNETRNNLPKPENSQSKLSPTSMSLLEAAANVASSLDEAVETVIQSSPRAKRKQFLEPLEPKEVLSVMERSYNCETLSPGDDERTQLIGPSWDEECHKHLTDFADKLSEKLLQEIDQYQEASKKHDKSTYQHFDDPYISRLSAELDDLNKLSAEIQKQNEYLSKLTKSDVYKKISECDISQESSYSEKKCSFKEQSIDSNDTISQSDESTASLKSCSELNHITKREEIKKIDSVNEEMEQYPSVNTSLSDDNSQESLPSDNIGGSITYHRFYHVFKEGELDQLIERYVENLHIISSYYDHASWCIVAEKVQVWTI